MPLSNVEWDATANQYSYNCTQYGCQTGYGYVVTTAGWNPLPLQFGRGRMLFRSAGDYCVTSGSSQRWNTVLTRGTFVTPDGTETEFVDQQTGGAAEAGNLGYNRGTVFKADNGTFAKFTSNISISDPTSCGFATSYASGTMVLRDGTTYTISGGYVTSIRDSNGNLTNFSGNNITDSLNRVYSTSSGQIQYPGAGGTLQTITIKYSSLSNLLAPGESIKTFGQLWPGLPTSSQASNLNQSYNPNDRVSEIDLPDGSKYLMTYHSYGDVAQITLPTGGVIQYDYSTSSNSWSASPATMYLLTRPVSGRREYLGSTLVSKTVFPSSNEIDRYDGSGNLLAKEIYTISNTGTGPTSGTNYNSWQYNQQSQVNYYDADGSTLLESVNSTYVQQNCAVNCSTVQTVKTIMNGVVKQTSYTYDQYNNVSDQKDYDWGSGGPGGLLRDVQTSYVTSSSSYNYTAVNILGLPLAIKMYDGSTNLYGFTQYTYDESPNPNTGLGLSNCPGIIGHDNTNFAGGAARGNPTTIGRCLISNNTCNSWLNTYVAYDIAGNVITVTDANNHTTGFSYNDNYPDGNRNSYGFVTVASNALGQVPLQAQYDYSTGQPVVTADINGHYTTYNYATSGYALDRLVQVNYANGGHTYYSYPSPTEVITQQDQTSSGDAALKSQTLYDGFGRVSETDTFESGPQYIATTQSYDALGRIASTTNPYRSTSDMTYGVTTYTYDGLGRTKAVKTPDGAVATTSYSGDQVTATDQAGHAKNIVIDALGRLRQVVEDPGGLNYSMLYTFGADATLQKVVKGSQTRTFSYDSDLSIRCENLNKRSGHGCPTHPVSSS
jgi:YD repeat-containing protein